MNSILAFWKRITSPRIPLSELDEIARIQLFASLMLTGFLVISGIELVDLLQNGLELQELLLRLVLSLIIFILYCISRYGYIHESSIGLAILGSGFIIINPILTPEPEQIRTLNYLITITITLSIFLSLLETALIFIVQLISLIFLPLVSEVSFEVLINGPISLNLTLGIILLVIIQYRKQLEDIRQRTLRLSEESYRTLTENAPVEIVRLNRNREITYINRSIMPDELPVEQIVGQQIVYFVLEEDRSLFQQKLDDLFQNKPTQIYEVRTPIPQGKIQTYQVTQAPILVDGHVTEGILFALNITAQQQVKLALEENEARYQTVVSALAEGVMVQNQNGDIIAYNQSAVEILGLEDQLNEMASLDPHRRSIHEDGSEYLAEEHPSMVTLRTGEPIRGAIMGIYHADGELRWISINSQPLLHQGENEPYAVVASFTDITESRKYLHDLQQYAAMLRALIDAPTDSISLLEIDGTFLAHNETALRRTQSLPDGATSLVGLNIFDLIESDWQQRVRDSIESVISSKEPYRFQRQSQSRWFDMVLFPILDGDNQVTQLGLMSREITEQKMLEFSLTQSLEQLETFFTNSANGIFFADFPRAIKPFEVAHLSDDEVNELFNDAVITKANPAWINIYGGTRERVLEHPIESIFGTAQDRTAIRREILATGKNVSSTEQTLKNGTVLWIESEVVCIYDIAEQIVGYFGVQRDITEHKLKEEHRFEEERAKILANFVQDALHEFRTPLSAILLATHMLGKSDEPEDIGRRTDRIREQVERIQTLVDDLGDISQLDNSTPVLESISKLNDLINSIFLAIHEDYSERDLQFDLALTDQSGEIMVNEYQLQLALTKLLDNAVRYTPDGGSISVRTQITSDEFRLEVADTGIGIETEHLPRIFERFYRVDVAHTTQGFGLGLATVRLIVERHNGEIDVVSTPGEGSTFTIRLPLTTEETPEPPLSQSGTSR